MSEKALYPQKGTAKRVISGALFTVLGEAIGSLKHILLVPLFLRAWGKMVYGEWLTIYALVAYLPLVDMGVQNYVVNRLTQSYGRGETKEYNEILQSALRLYLIIIFIASLFFALFVFFAPLNQWFHILFTHAKTIKLTAFILGVYLLWGILLGLIAGLYHSFGEYPRRALIFNVREVLLISLLAAGLFLKKSFIVIAFLHFIPFFVLIAYCFFDIKRRHKELSFSFSKAKWKTSFGFIGPGFLFLMIVLADALKIQGSILIVGSALGAGAVAIFSVHRTLANLISKIINSVNCAIWPELTAAEARRDYRKMETAHNFLIKFSLFFSFSLAIFLFFTGKELIAIWTQKRIEFQPLLWMLFLGYLPLNVFWETSGIFQVSTNRHKKYALAKLSSAILAVILAVILTKTWGMTGTLLGFIIVESIICSWFIPLETLKIIKANKKDFWLKTVGKGFFLILPQILIGWIFSKLTLNIFIQWILLALGVFFVGAIISYIFWLNKEERGRLQLIKSCFWK